MTPTPAGSGPGGGVPPWLLDLLAGNYGAPSDLQSGGPNAMNPILSTADLTASGQLQAGYGAAANNWENTLGTQTQNQQPFINAGQSSIGALMQAIQSGKFGPGSLGPVPTAPGTFSAPTLEQAQQQPGYQFTLQQGNKGVLEGAAAAGGSISGGTLKALDLFNQGAATTNYNNVFNQAMQGYGANLQQYGAQLQGYNTGMAAQQQGFNQLFQPAGLGQTAANNLNTNLGTGALNIGQLMSAIGAAQAGGTLTATTDYLQGSDLLKALQQKLAAGRGGSGAGSAAPGPGGSAPSPGVVPGQTPGTTPPFVPPGSANSTVNYPGTNPGTGGGFWAPDPSGLGGPTWVPDPSGGGGSNDPGTNSGGGGGADTGGQQDPGFSDNALVIRRLLSQINARRQPGVGPG